MSEVSSEETADYEHLRRKRKETEGTVELAEIVDVWVGEREVVCRFGFEWTSERVRRRYDLDSDRDVARLEALCETNGLAFEQATHLDGAFVELTYTGEAWVPTAEAAYADGEGGAVETFRAESRLLVRELATAPAVLRRGVERVRALTVTQTIIGVVLVKKVAIVALLAYLLL
ncbi:hypothetical protein NDI56_10060 [Haloarcula sp. S1CR25-12]|uniref:Uncharacterized protein n=1 Tax=Haloarcula saliterrae TaxID=2950534 RepID=A0ABU2FBY3_9EURY|nr:hypothetical protein [Haloarcula sp. S1CR25-12]MDS0259736.1 hypothetical protein [Haloarcula sp. S1CR25-12]